MCIGCITNPYSQVAKSGYLRVFIVKTHQNGLICGVSYKPVVQKGQSNGA
jgi:hypothetical protein